MNRLSARVQSTTFVRSAGMACRAVGSCGSGLLRGRTPATATIQTIGARTAVLFVNLATGVISARWLGATGRGELTALLAGTWLFGGLFTLGLPSSVIYNLKCHREDRSSLIAAAVLLSVVIGSVGTCAGMIAIPIWLNDYSTSVQMHAQWLMLTLPFGLLVLICNAAFEVRGDFSFSNAARLLTPVTTLCVLTVLALNGQMTPLRAALAYVAGAVVAVWTLARVWMLYQPTLRGMRRSIARLLLYGYRAWGVDLLYAISQQADQVMVVGLMAPRLVGTYAVALSAARTLNAVTGSVYTVLFPRIASELFDVVVVRVGQSVRVMLVATVTAAVGMIVFGPSLLQLFYGPEFVAGGGVLRLLVVEAALSGVAVVLAQSFMALNRPGVVSTIQAAGLAFSVLLMSLFIPRYGLIGAGLALLLATTCRLVLLLACYPLVLKVRPPSIVPTRADFAPLRAVLMSRS